MASLFHDLVPLWSQGSAEGKKPVIRFQSVFGESLGPAEWCHALLLRSSCPLFLSPGLIWTMSPRNILHWPHRLEKGDRKRRDGAERQGRDVWIVSLRWPARRASEIGTPGPA